MSLNREVFLNFFDVRGINGALLLEGLTGLKKHSAERPCKSALFLTVLADFSEQAAAVF